MIISHKHKFIYIKTFKTAGTSVEIALSKACGDDDIITPIYLDDEKLRESLGYKGAQNYDVPSRYYNFRDWAKRLLKNKKKQYYNHISATEIKNLIDPDIWNTYYKFCFERNPWDKVISHYYWKYRTEPRPSLSEHINSGLTNLASSFDLYSINDKLVVNKVGFFENLQSDLSDICHEIGIKEEIELPMTKGGARKDKRHHDEIMSAEDKENIRKLFSREIKQFGY